MKFQEIVDVKARSAELGISLTQISSHQIAISATKSDNIPSPNHMSAARRKFGSIQIIEIIDQKPIKWLIFLKSEGAARCAHQERNGVVDSEGDQTCHAGVYVKGVQLGPGQLS